MSGVLETNLKSLPFLHKGKVRDIYAVGEDKLLVIQTDRLSAFDVILNDPIPAKGKILTSMLFLSLKRHRRDRPGLKASQRNRLASDFAIAIFAIVETTYRGIDLGDQLALPVAGAKFDRPVGLARGAVGNIRFAQRVDLELRHGRATFFDNRFFPVAELAEEISPLLDAHELFFVSGTIIVRKQNLIELSGT